jgi:hypothetical protein
LTSIGSNVSGTNTLANALGGSNSVNANTGTSSNYTGGQDFANSGYTATPSASDQYSAYAAAQPSTVNTVPTNTLGSGLSNIGTFNQSALSNYGGLSY